MDDLKDEGRRPSLPASSTINDVHYTPIEVIPTTSFASNSSAATTASAAATAAALPSASGPYTASPPSGGGVHYSTIVNTRESALSPLSTGQVGSGSDYMVMTPVNQTLQQHSGSSSSTSSLKRHSQLEPERKRLSMLGLEEDPFPNLSLAGVTSPSSQSSYNPLDEDETEPSYLVMSPVGSSSGGGTLPKRGTSSTTSAVGIPSSSSSSYHRRTGSSSFRSGSVEVKEDEETQYVTMSPTVMLSKQGTPHSSGRQSSARGAASSATVFGTSPSAALTSHFSERLPLFEPAKKSAAPKFESSGEEVGGYLVMSPVNTDNLDKTPRSSTSMLSDKFRTRCRFYETCVSKFFGQILPLNNE
jgi:hypothetical protein